MLECERGRAMKIKQIFTFSVLASMLCSQTLYASAEEIADENKQSYVIMAENSEVIGELYNEGYDVETLSEASEEELNGTASGEIGKIDLTSEEAAALETCNGVLGIEEDIMFYATGEAEEVTEIPEETQEENPEWNMQLIHAAEIEESIPEQKIKVAVIDSGIDMMEEVPVTERVNLVPGEEDISPVFEDGTCHGTSVAGIIAAQDNEEGITGINPNAELYSVKVLDNQNSAPLSRVIEGIYWAIEHEADIINMSFGTKSYSPSLEAAIQDAYGAGILMIASAGNDGSGELDYPAAFEEVISVGSVDSDGNISPGSSGGSNAELMAPGESVKSSWYLGGVIYTSGTSMATPHVTGVASLLWQKNPERSAEEIRKILKLSANQYNNILDASYALEVYDNLTENAYDFTEINEEIVEKNVAPVPEVERNSQVTASWNGKKHAELIVNNKDVTGGTLTNKEIDILKISAQIPDKGEYRDLDTARAMHAAERNYVAVARYLFRVAYNFRYMPDAEFTADKAMDEWFFAKDQNATIKRDMKNIINKIREENSLEINETQTRRHTSFKVLGLMTHVLSDTYAHATVVPKVETTSTNLADSQLGTKFYTGDFKDINQFKTAVKNGFVKFCNIDNYMTKAAERPGRYEDNVNFYSQRYKNANTVVRNVMISYFAKEKDFMNDILVPSISPKLYKFKTHFDEAFANSIPSDLMSIAKQMSIGD